MTNAQPQKNFSCKNQLLSLLLERAADLFQPQLELVDLKLRHQVEQPRKPIDFVYFPESGILSVLALEGDRQIEAGIIGLEGMSGLPVILGDHLSPHACMTLVASKAYRLPCLALRQALASSLPVRELLTKYAHSMMIQRAYSALANGQANIEERLARWLLMSQDRLGDELPLTHELLAFMLGVRRAGITEALHALESKSLIRTSRGRVFIADRSGLKQAAAGLYGTPEAEYERMLGRSFSLACASAGSDLLVGRSVLFVEEDHGISAELGRDLSKRGAIVLGPVSTLESALNVVNGHVHVDIAVLNLDLGEGLTCAIADALECRGVTVILATSTDSASASLQEAYSHFPHCRKPLRAAELAHAVAAAEHRIHDA